MNTFKPILLFALAIASLASCKKDSNNPGPGDPQTPETELIQFTNGDEYVKFNYGTDNNISTVILKNEIMTDDEETTYNVEYANGKIASLTSPMHKLVPVYENGALKRTDMFENDEKVSFTSYDYENNKLKNVTLYYNNDGTYHPMFGYVLNYANSENPSEVIAMMAGNQPNLLVRAGSVNMQFDSRVNPLYKHKDLLLMLWQVSSKNNVTAEDHFDEALTLEDKYVYTYDYFNNGLPKSAKVKKGLPGQPSETININYIYE